jgi:hypothetical protein
MSSCGTLVSIVDESGYSCEIYLDYEIPNSSSSNTFDKEDRQTLIAKEPLEGVKSEKTSSN